MNKIATVGLSLIMGASLLVLSSPAAEASDRTCRGAIANTTISGNVRVPAGATCELTNVLVRGNVELNSRSNVKIYGRGVLGNVQGESAGNVSLYRARISAMSNSRTRATCTWAARRSTETFSQNAPRTCRASSSHT